MPRKINKPSLPVTENATYNVNGIVVHHQFSNAIGGFHHRLVIGGIAGSWSGYLGITLFVLGKRTFGGTTEYYKGILPSVFEIIGGKKDE